MFWKYILLLVLFVPCCLFCDTTGVNEIVNFEDFRKKPLLMASLNYIVDNENYSIGLGMKIRNGVPRNSISGIGFELNLMSVSIIKNDVYNNNAMSYSIFSFFGIGIMGATYLTKQIELFDTNNLYLQIFDKVGIGIFVLNNPQLNIKLYDIKINNSSLLSSDLFVNYKFDYFINNTVDWSRLKLAFGIEINYIKYESTFGLGFSLGYSKSYDSVGEDRLMVPYGNIKILIRMKDN